MLRCALMRCGHPASSNLCVRTLFALIGSWLLGPCGARQCVTAMLASNQNQFETPVHGALGLRAGTAILVLGMHRSGTSALAGALSLLGGKPPRTMLPANDFNERGYWESVPLISVTERLLQSLESRWDDLGQIDVAKIPKRLIESYRGSFRRVLADEYDDGSTVLIVKDPRICRIAPVVFELLKDAAFSAVPLLVFRNPLEVAFSLERRDGFAVHRSLLLWLRHNLDAEFFTRTMARSVISYEDFLGDWRAVLTRSLDAVGAAKGARWRPQQEKEVENFLASELRHEKRSNDDLPLHESVNEWIKTTHKSLIALANNGSDTGALAALDSVREQFNEASALFGPLLLATEKKLNEATTASGDLALQLQKSSHDAAHMREASVAEIQSVVHEHNKLAAALTKSSLDADQMRADLLKETASVWAALDVSEKRAADLTERLASADARLVALDASEKRAADLSARLARADARLSTLGAAEMRVADLSARLANTDARAVKRDAELKAAGERLAQQAEKVAFLLSVVEQRAAEVEVLHQSTSWKITRPLRLVSRLTKRVLGRG